MPMASTEPGAVAQSGKSAPLPSRELVCPHFSAQQSIPHHCIKRDGSWHLYPALIPILSPSTKASQQVKRLYASSPAEPTQHQSKARVLSRLGQVSKDGGCFLGVEARGRPGKGLLMPRDHRSHKQQNRRVTSSAKACASF